MFLYAIWYLGYPLKSTENFYGYRPGEPIRWQGVKARGVAKYNNFGPIEGYRAYLGNCAR